MSDSRSWYFVNQNAHVLGPLDEVKLAEKLASKELTPQSLVWNGRLAEKWTRLRNVPGLLPRLRRKSRGFSQLDITLRRVSELAVKKCADKISFIVSYLSNSDSDSEIESNIEDESSDTASLSEISEKTDELEEKCPILTPRPLASMMSERSEDVSPVPSLPRLIMNSPSLDRTLMVTTSPLSDDGMISEKIGLIPHSSEEPLCLGMDDTGMHFISKSYELLRGKDQFEHETSVSMEEDDSEAVFDRALFNSKSSSSSLWSESTNTCSSTSSSSSEMPLDWAFESD